MSLMKYDDALEQLINQIPSPNQTQTIPLMHSLGRVLAKEITAQYDAPRFDNSAMDGYAVNGLDCEQWELIDYIAAGDQTNHLQLQKGQAVRIFTGAATPLGTEAVIAQEDTHTKDKTLFCDSQLKAKQHIRFKAEEYAQGDVLIPAQQKITATSIGVIASQGFNEVSCYVRPRITVFSSGDELQALGQPLAENQIYDSNRFMLLACLQDALYDVYDGGLLPDEKEITKIKLEDAAEKNDILILSGGASVGEKDFAVQSLKELGELKHWRLAIKPGKPFAWGKIKNTHVFLLPGNPVASWVTLLVLALPAIKKLAGIPQKQALPQVQQAKAQFELTKSNSRMQFLRGNAFTHNGQLQVDIHPMSLQSSAMLAKSADSNALILVPPQTQVEKDQIVDIIYLFDNRKA